MDVPSDHAPVIGPYLDTLHTIKSYRNVFVILTLLSVVVHLSAWAIIDYGEVLHADTRLAKQEIESGREPGGDLDNRSYALRWENWLQRVLPLAEFVGRLSIVMLVMASLLAVLVILSGRLGGATQITQAFFVFTLVGLLFVPWDRWFPDQPSIPGVFSTYDKLKQSCVVEADQVADDEAQQPVEVQGRKVATQQDMSRLIRGARFGGLPLLAAIMVMVAGARFGRAYRNAIVLVASRTLPPPPLSPRI